MTPTLLCFSHLRWNFVYQRPQHLMNRFAKVGKVFFIEEPIYGPPWRGFKAYKPYKDANVTILVPYLPSGLSQPETDSRLSAMLHDFLAANEILEFIAWYYSPMAISYTASLAPLLTVYDCMDELSAFKFAPSELKEREARLFSQADVVFTGGRHLFSVKKKRHHNIHAFPSSIDREHFANARHIIAEPDDQVSIPHPRLGYYGVLDERLDIGLIEGIAVLRPEWQIVLVGPVVKIDPSTLPQQRNIHYLGSKKYDDLPAYLAGWDVAIMPFALNESTQFISPTKTPEFLAGGKYVISTPIVDVVNDYGKAGLVGICSKADAFVAEAEKMLATTPESRTAWLKLVDARLANDSWDITWQQMFDIIETTLQTKKVVYEKYLQTCSITL